MDDASATIIAQSVVEYIEWLSGRGGASPEELLARPLSGDDRRELLGAMDDAAVVWGITAAMRDSLREDAATPEPSASE